MDIFWIVVWGVAGSTLYQLLMIKDYYEVKRHWPWKDFGKAYSIFAFVLYLFIAGCIVGAFGISKGLTGALAPLVMGAGADSIFRSLVKNRRKGA